MARLDSQRMDNVLRWAGQEPALWKRLLQLVNGKHGQKVEFVHVKGHAGTSGMRSRTNGLGVR